jgi:hypothetical protein
MGEDSLPWHLNGKLVSGIIKHSRSSDLSFSRDLTEVEQKLSLLDHLQLLPTLKRPLCWNFSLASETPTVLLEEGVYTRFCCVHHDNSTETLAFRNKIVKHNKQKQASYLFYTSLPEEILNNLCRSSVFRE